MGTAIFTLGETQWAHPPSAFTEADSMQIRTVSCASWPPRPIDSAAPASLGQVMDEFVELVKDNPKVWAVYATEDHKGITVWTYIDSSDRNDRSLVYDSEWRLLNMFPEVGFDFNTALVPAGAEEFDDQENVYLYRR